MIDCHRWEHVSRQDREDGECRMSRETMEILAIWKESPSFFSSGLMQWVAEVDGPECRHSIRESPAFPMDKKHVTDDDSDDANPFICIVRDQMSDERREVVEKMHHEFVASLERDGWMPTGQGRDWYNLHFERIVRP